MSTAAAALDELHRMIADHLIRECHFTGARLSEGVRNCLLHALMRLQLGHEYAHAHWLMGGPELDAKIARFTSSVTDPGARRTLATAVERILHPGPAVRAA